MNKRFESRYKASEWRLFFMVLPFIICAFFLFYVPLLGWIIGFFDYRPGISLFDSEFIGLRYFREIFTDKDILRSLKNTLIFSGISYVLAPLPMLFAVCLNEISNRRYRKWVQTATTLPHFISWVIIYSFAFAMFSSEGVLNNVLQGMGVIEEPLRLLENVDIVYPFQIAINHWKELGWWAIIYIAAIAGIDQEQYEAARIDGAGRFKVAWHITIPCILPTFIVQLLLSVSNIINTGYEQYFVFKNAFVYDQIEVLDLYIYRMGLQLGDYSYATAVGTLKSLIGIVMLFIANALAKKVRGTAII